MNEYRFEYTTPDGSSGTASMIDFSEQAARKEFKETNRGYKIDSVDLVTCDLPATKHHERQAIEQIEEIIRSLGFNSYVGTAMKGVLRIASRSIEDDAAYCMADDLEAAEAAAAAASQEAESLRRENKALTERIEAHQGQVEALARDLTEAVAFGERTEAQLDNTKAQLHAAQQEVVELKAKLYDLMMKEGGGDQ